MTYGLKGDDGNERFHDYVKNVYYLYYNNFVQLQLFYRIPIFFLQINFSYYLFFLSNSKRMKHQADSDEDE